jgi:hypothetical protein
VASKLDYFCASEGYRGGLYDGSFMTRCSHLLAELTEEERAGLKVVATGKGRAIPAAIFTRLRAERLVQYDGKGWTLTADGRAIAIWCD